MVEPSVARRSASLFDDIIQVGLSSTLIVGHCDERRKKEKAVRLLWVKIFVGSSQKPTTMTSSPQPRPHADDHTHHSSTADGIAPLR